MLKYFAVLLCVVIMFMLLSCTQHKVEVEIAPVEVKPIHITIDVNVKVDKALDNFFDDIDQTEATADEIPSEKK